MKQVIIGAWLVLGCLAASGCREVCTVDELRQGDRCVPRPVRDASDDATGEPDASDEDVGSQGDGSEPAETPDAGEPSGHADACADSGCEATCTGGACMTDPCDPNPCANDGTCSPVGKLCTCLVGFSGPTCEVDACDPNPCQHGGACMRTLGGGMCDCSNTGSRGAYCENDIDECGAANVCSGMNEGVLFNYACKNAQPHYSCVGQFPDWQLADPPNRFSALSGFPIVVDEKTGLTWQQAGEGPRPLAAAKSYCEGLSTASFEDWRLPTKAELESIVDFARSQPALDARFSPTVDWHWTSSPVVGSSAGEVWVIDFAFGESLRSGPSENNRVRCVR